MVAAGMVPPPSDFGGSTPSAPLQRRAESALSDAIQRAETNSRPDIFEALKAARMVSDRNAVQRTANNDSAPEIAPTVEQASALPSIQRVINTTETETPAENEVEIKNEKDNIPAEINMDKLAHDVYRVLRRMFRTDNERRSK
jgi:hypothetical protein